MLYQQNQTTPFRFVSRKLNANYRFHFNFKPRRATFELKYYILYGVDGEN